ncbi:hypothetical protein J3L18_19245 [Mucilaginibacter gossypii]|uniref:hypothetical protein n=1 Tax=Mucilaginibacter gossypii TaxID=551996 RepID=UPI001679B1A2|nr:MULTISPECIES: hypothetical protein [Mucilaginibacter]QTE35275.1 hypothetical protein J3L18_19245 [Mucilaginibacter gossypii]
MVTKINAESALSVYHLDALIGYLEQLALSLLEQPLACFFHEELFRKLYLSDFSLFWW